jgi:hypothetical protein
LFSYSFLYSESAQYIQYHNPQVKFFTTATHLFWVLKKLKINSEYASGEWNPESSSPGALISTWLADVLYPTELLPVLSGEWVFIRVGEQLILLELTGTACLNIFFLSPNPTWPKPRAAQFLQVQLLELP